ncbi:MAG: OmpA family protein [Alphaproteobacteria bacterium]|nr:MAG: OmpA family protein [Alphaproteobacteria bacterium]
MPFRIRAGLLAAIAAVALPQIAPAQTMTAEEILRRIQEQREALARQDRTERTRTLKFVDSSNPAPSEAEAAAVVSTAPAAPAAPGEEAAPAPVAPAATAAPPGSAAPALLPAAATETLPVVEERIAIDLVVYFEFDSAVLRPEAREQLDQLCTALSRDTGTYEIIGHTDAAGSEDYNLRLSRARAQEVVRYLVKSCGIAPERLRAHGLGEARLKDPANPRAAVNRRVEIQVAS